MIRETLEHIGLHIHKVCYIHRHLNNSLTSILGPIIKLFFYVWTEACSVAIRNAIYALGINLSISDEGVELGMVPV